MVFGTNHRGQVPAQFILSEIHDKVVVMTIEHRHKLTKTIKGLEKGSIGLRQPILEKVTIKLNQLIHTAE
jgi:hypothetical protein